MKMVTQFFSVPLPSNGRTCLADDVIVLKSLPLDDALHMHIITCVVKPFFRDVGVKCKQFVHFKQRSHNNLEAETRRIVDLQKVKPDFCTIKYGDQYGNRWNMPGNVVLNYPATCNFSTTVNLCAYPFLHFFSILCDICEYPFN